MIIYVYLTCVVNKVRLKRFVIIQRNEINLLVVVGNSGRAFMLAGPANQSAQQSKITIFCTRQILSFVIHASTKVGGLPSLAKQGLLCCNL
ncbi:hypothetical protein C2869_07185 [Saccharobesus litoralis]|uniref:Uncharacterized protein n=1 Tax=Saccharobesus litoralis TaxID=2172099 RepID=A0A2S0VPT7_9ALTE|nr:hypothetical protein C2869_07185 [Saccharobesus litoralis]